MHTHIIKLSSLTKLINKKSLKFSVDTISVCVLEGSNLTKQCILMTNLTLCAIKHDFEIYIDSLKLYLSEVLDF